MNAPVVVALDASGVATVHAPDEPTHTITSVSVDAARKESLAYIVSAIASRQLQPVTVVAKEPAGTFAITIDGDGAVVPLSEVPDHQDPTAAPARQNDQQPSAEPAPLADDAAPVVNEDGSLDAEEQAPPRSRRRAALENALAEAPAEVIEEGPRPRPTAADFADSQAPDPQAPAQIGWRGLLRRLTLGLVAVAPGAREINLRAWSAAVLRGLAGHKLIVVINEKGGVGKTTSTFLLSAVLGRYRGGTVLAWDNNENRGTLGQRGAVASHDHTAIDLLNEVDEFGDQTIVSDLLNYVRPQGPNKFDLLASQNKTATSQVIDASAFGRMRATLSKFYRMVVVDTGNNSSAATWRAAVDAADEIVIVSTLREDSAQAAAVVADTLWELGYEDKLKNAVTILSAPAEKVDEELRARVTSHMSRLTRSVVEVPYDGSLVDGKRIDYDRLSTASKDAWLHAAAEVVKGL